MDRFITQDVCSPVETLHAEDLSHISTPILKAFFNSNSSPAITLSACGGIVEHHMTQTEREKNPTKKEDTPVFGSKQQQAGT